MSAISALCLTERIPVLVLSGTEGAGKTALALAVSEQLTAAGVAHACVDADGLTWVYPRPADDPYGSRLMIANLATLWANAYTAGARRLVLPRVIEETGELDALLETIPNAMPTLVRVTAPAALGRDRLVQRQQGSGLEWSQGR